MNNLEFFVAVGDTTFRRSFAVRLHKRLLGLGGVFVNM